MNPASRISLCMILKNEEVSLPRCLRSVQDVVRQLVVVDTGSTDRTKEIAALFGAELHDFVWTNDFSAARNFSLSFATCPWVMVMDADEEMAPETAAHLLESVQIAERKKLETIAFELRDRNHAGKFTSSSFQPRLWRRSESVYYKNAIHNMLLFKSPVLRGDLVVYHYGYEALSKEAFEQKRQRNFAIFKSEYAKTPDDTRLGWELAREYCVAEQNKEALTVITHTIACHRKQFPDRPVEMLMYEYLARSQHGLGQLDQAFETLREARVHYPDHFTFLLRICKIHAERKEWRQAKEASKTYFEKVALYREGKTLQREVMVEGLFSEPESKNNMAVICCNLGELDECCQWLLDAYRDGCEELSVKSLAEMSGALGKKFVLPLLLEMAKCRKSKPLKDLMVAVCQQLTVEDMEYMRRFMAELKAWPRSLSAEDSGQNNELRPTGS